MKKEIDKYLKKLFPITRSITGEGNRKTLKILQEIIPLEIKEYPTGQKVYDWEIPKEWNIQDGWIKDSLGNKIIDFKKNNLHIVSYSQPIYKKLKLQELKEHLHYLKNLSDAIPYRTSYYNENWGFCLSYDDYQKYFENLDDNEEFEVFIDSKFKNGSLTIGELLIEGRSKKEYLISCYICHPSMANDSLSGVIATTFIARELLKIKDKLEHSYRIIFLPETIGAIAYLANNEEQMKKIETGLVITTCGGPGTFGYKASLNEKHWINQMVEDIFEKNNINYIKYPFDVHGSDERQYSSQGFRINCVTITKDKYYEYDFYHTSLDNLNFVKPTAIKKSVDLYLELLNLMDKNIYYKNNYPNGEVMLSKHDLYPKTGGALLPNKNISALSIILESLFYFDGTIGLYEMSKKLNINIDLIYKALRKLENKGILQRVLINE
jgi:aminopeptidase-like protein